MVILPYDELHQPGHPTLTDGRFPVILGASTFTTEAEARAAFPSMTKTIRKLFHSEGDHQIGAAPCSHGHHVVAWAIGGAPTKLVKKLHKKLNRFDKTNHDCEESSRAIGQLFVSVLLGGDAPTPTDVVH